MSPATGAQAAPRGATPAHLGGAPAVSAVDLSCSFGDFVAVDRVSFEVQAGEIFGFLGSNGAGKTTTIRILCGLIAPSSGQATVAGFDVAGEAASIKRRIGYMSQRFSLYTDLSVDENLAFWASTYGVVGREFEQRRRWGVAMAGLGERRKSLVRDLPGGYRQRLALVCALLHEPSVVFLDEPTGGVDPAARRRFWDLIDQLADQGTTVFVTTHYMDEAERCHRVALMHAGRLLALDSVPGLKAAMSDSAILELRCAGAARALELIDQQVGVRDAALFGSSVHVEVEHPGVAPQLLRALESSGFGPAEVRTIPPTLEDVFIRAIRDAEAGVLS